MDLTEKPLKPWSHSVFWWEKDLTSWFLFLISAFLSCLSEVPATSRDTFSSPNLRVKPEIISFPSPKISLNFGHPSTWENGEAYCNGLITLSPSRRMGRVYGVQDGCWVSLKSQSKCYWNAFLCRFGIVWVWRGMQCQESLCCVCKYTVSSRDLLLSLSHHKLVRSFSQACQSEVVQAFCFAGVRMQGGLCSIVEFSGFACCSMSKKVGNLLQAAIF